MRTALSKGNGLRYAFADAGGGRSIFSEISKENIEHVDADKICHGRYTQWINGEMSEGAADAEIKLGKADLDALRKKWNVPERNTIAVGKTDVAGLDDITFEVGSPAARKEAGFENYDISNPNRAIKSSGKIPSATRHAEEVVANEFVEAVEKAGIKSEDVVGTLRIHQSNPSGVCPTCLSGLGNPNKAAGVIKQLSLKYPNLMIEVTSETAEGAKVNGRLAYKLYLYLENMDETDVMTYMQFEDDVNREKVWICIGNALAYTIWEAYQYEKEKFLPQTIESFITNFNQVYMNNSLADKLLNYLEINYPKGTDKQVDINCIKISFRIDMNINECYKRLHFTIIIMQLEVKKSKIK